MKGFTAMLYLCQFAISAMNKPGQWWGAQVCYVAGIVGMFASYVDGISDVLSDEHDGSFLCCNLSRSCTRPARGHTVREGGLGGHTRVSIVPQSAASQRTNREGRQSMTNFSPISERK